MTITKSGELASFYTVNKAPIKHLRVYFNPKQTGSGDPSPSNVRPISGYTGLEVTRCGKNFFNSDIENGGFNSSTGEEIVNEKRLRSGFVFLKAGTYTISSSTSYMMVIVYIYDINKNYMSNELINVFNYMPYTFTINGDRYIRLIWRRSDNTKIINDSIDNLQIEFGTTSSNYKSYSSTTIPVDWSSEAGTLYDGYIDLITGELQSNYESIIFDGTEDWIRTNVSSNPTSDRYTLWLSEDDNHNYYKPINNKIYCSHYKYIGTTWGDYGTYRYNYNSTGGKAYIQINDPNFEHLATLDDLTTYFATQYNNGTPVHFVIPLKNPVTYQLTPQQINTFLGRNNIWSNANRVEVEYDLAESNDELYKRRNILLRSVPHIETASGNIINFQTDVIAPMKSAKINFSPIQEGSGNPTPHNVRNITGWEGCNVICTGKNLFNIQDFVENYQTYNTSKVGRLLLHFKPNTQYTISTNLPVQDVSCNCFAWSGAIEQTASSPTNGVYSTRTITTDSNGLMTLGLYYTDDHINYTSVLNGTYYIQIEQGSISTTYEPYVSTIISSDWSLTAGTLYGGYIDLSTGELVQTKMAMNPLNWTIAYSGETTDCYKVYFYTTHTSATEPVAHSAISNRFSRGVSNSTLGYLDNYGAMYTTILKSELNAISLAGAKQWFIDNPTIIIYDLKNPTHYQLTPQQLQTFRGVNNICTNSNGLVEIKYWTH